MSEKEYSNTSHYDESSGELITELRIPDGTALRLRSWEDGEVWMTTSNGVMLSATAVLTQSELRAFRSNIDKVLEDLQRHENKQKAE